MSVMPLQKPHRSKQDYGTPPEFLYAVVKRFGGIDFDLAADTGNTVNPHYYDVATDSLAQDWSKLIGNLWLNPPFKNIDDWSNKCAHTSRAAGKILLLVPASVGANWFRDFVDGYASQVYFLNGRLSFDGKNPFPKDCMLCVYEDFREFYGTLYDVWDWRKDVDVG